MPKQQINLTYVIVATIIGAAVFGFGQLAYLDSSKERRFQQDKLQQERDKKEQDTRTQSHRLFSCIYQAEESYNGTFEINSSPNPQPGHPDARDWESAEIREVTIKKLQEDKDLCAKLYPQN